MDRYITPISTRLIATLVCCLLLGACSLGSCESTDCLATDQVVASTEEPALVRSSDESVTSVDSVQGTDEPVQQIAHDGDVLTFAVLSTGCTVAAHFHIEHEILESGCSATLVRDQADLCRRAPALAELSLPWQAPESCSAAGITFTNSIVDLAARMAPTIDTGRVPRAQQQ